MESTCFQIRDHVLIRYSGDSAHVELPQGIHTIGSGAFKDNHRLCAIDLPEGLTRIDDFAFYGCRNLRQVHIPDSLDSIGSFAFAYCSRLVGIFLPRGLSSLEERAFLDCRQLSFVNIPEKTAVAGGVFHGCCLSHVELAPRADYSGILDGSLMAAVRRCILCGGALEPDWERDQLRCSQCGQAFDWDNLEDWGNFVVERGVCVSHVGGGGTVPQGVTAVASGAFDDGVVPELVFPDSVTQLGTGALIWCDFALNPILPRKLRRLEYGVLAGSNICWLTLPQHLEYIGETALAGCDNLKEITIPDSVRIIGPRAFHSCAALDTLELGAGVERIGAGAFASCPHLEVVSCPGSLRILEEQAFHRCDHLTHVILNEGLLRIGEGAFSACKNLHLIKIPRSVLSIGQNAFRLCPRLRTALVPESLKNINLGDIFDDHTQIRFYTP